jgi:hypothetical protein
VQRSRGGDYDNDGDLDILLPSSPTTLAVQLNDTADTFTWDPASDTETPPAGLSCNLWLGTTAIPCRRRRSSVRAPASDSFRI